MRVNTTDGDLVHAADSFPDDGECVVADFPVGDRVVGVNEVTGVDVALGDKLVDVDRPCRFQSDVLKLFFRHLHVGVGIDL